MALTINGKKVLGYALGDNEYLSGGNLNAFYIDMIQYDSSSDAFFTIDMTNYFKEADTKHPDVQYYQIMPILSYKDILEGNISQTGLITQLLKRGEINHKRSIAVGGIQATTAWFKDKNTLAFSATSAFEGNSQYVFVGGIAYVYGFTSQDVGSVS